MNTDEESISTNDADTECRDETIQVSSDNFSTNDNCIKIADPVFSDSNKTVKLDPVDNLSYGTTYTLRVNIGVQDALNNNMTSQYNHSGFTTSAFPSTTPTSGVFLAVGQYGTTFRSLDNGTSWDNGTCVYLDKHLYGAVYGNNSFVAVGESGKIARSTDNGSSWVNSSSGSNSTELRGVAYGNNTFVAVGNIGKVIRSTDNGSSWESFSSGVSTDHYLKGVAFGDNTFQAVGQASNYSNSYCHSNYRKEIFKAEYDASSWSKQDSPYEQCKDLYGVGYGGSNTFVAVGQGSKIVKSTNSGSSWDNVTSGISPYPPIGENKKLRAVAFGNNTFVAVGESGKIIRSANNGVTWSNSTYNTIRELYAVTFGNGTFVAVGETGTILTSPDGITWTTQDSGTTNTLFGVTFKQ